MRWREVLAGLGAATAWARTALAQPSGRRIGFLHSLSPEATLHVLAAFRGGLAEAGYVEGRNISIEYGVTSPFAQNCTLSGVGPERGFGFKRARPGHSSRNQATCAPAG